MKKLILITVAALGFTAAGCQKTCQCTDKKTTAYTGDLPIFEKPVVSTHEYTKEAKKCSDLNEKKVDNLGTMHIEVITECN